MRTSSFRHLHFFVSGGSSEIRKPLESSELCFENIFTQIFTFRAGGVAISHICEIYG
jgi:hypothetical protein